MARIVAWLTAAAALAVVCLPNVHAASHVVTGLSCSGASQTSISIAWSLPSPGGSDLTGYTIDVVRNDGLKTETYPQLAINNKHTSSNTWSGLSIYGGYEVTVTCVSSVTPTQAGVTATCTTDEGIPLVGPANVTSTATSYNAIDVTWNQIAAISRQGVIQGYRVEYWSAVDAATTTTANVASGTYSHSLTGLTTGRQYVATVKAYTSVGDGPMSSGVATTWSTVAGPQVNTTENATIYYCYQLWPGTIEFESAGQDMSCTPYAVVMFLGAALLAVLLLVVICLCCCGGGGKGGGGGGGGGDTVIVIEQESPEPPAYSPEPPSMATARDVGFDGFDDFDDGASEWASASNKPASPPPMADVQHPGAIEEEEDW